MFEQLPEFMTISQVGEVLQITPMHQGAKEVHPVAVDR